MPVSDHIHARCGLGHLLSGWWKARGSQRADASSDRLTADHATPPTPSIFPGKWPDAGANLAGPIGPRGHQGLKILALAALLLWGADTARAQDPAAQRGLTFVRVHCAQCHAIDRVSESPLKIAPPFRTLHLRYPVENLAEAFAEGISTGHPTMPQFRLDPGQIADLIAFLKTFER